MDRRPGPAATAAPAASPVETKKTGAVAGLLIDLGQEMAETVCGSSAR